MCGLKYSTLAVLLALCLPGCFVALEPVSQPERCKLPKPAKTLSCPSNKTSRYFFHDTKGCKRSGFCDPEDTSVYDTQTNQNYFLTKESCAAACQMHVRCPTLEPVANGTLSNDGVGYWGSSVQYSCNNGFILSGRAIRSCESDGNWISEAPLCIAQCSSPSTDGPFTFSPLQNFYTPGDTIVYSCQTGFGQLEQNKGRVCLDDGTWSGTEISCEVELQCTKEALSPIEFGSVLAPDSRSVGSKVIFSCHEGYIMYGTATIHCDESGEWSGDRPTCWKINIEMCEESDPEHSGSDVTNRTITLEQGERNTWFVPSISNPNPFVNKTFKWEEDIAELPGVSIVGNRLKFTTVLDLQMRKYHVSFCGFNAFFGIEVTEPTSHIKPEPIFHPHDVVISLGGDLAMMCVFRGCPSPNVTWYHNDDALLVDDRTSIEPSVQSSFTTSTLTVRRLTSEDLGSYRCMGTNGLGFSAYSNSGSVTLASDSTIVKRSSPPEESWCITRTPLSSDTVTLVGRVRREAVRLRSPTSTVYRMKVENVLSSGTTVILPNRNVRTIVFDQNAEAQQKLISNGLYILQGRLHENTLLIESHTSILNHTSELEQSIQQC